MEIPQVSCSIYGTLSCIGIKRVDESNFETPNIDTYFIYVLCWGYEVQATLGIA